MAGLDHPLFFLLEMLTSTDLNSVSGLAARSVLDAFRFNAGRDLTLSGSEALRDVVLGGLQVTRTATGVTVKPGAMLQAVWPGVGSQPTSNDSQSVLGRLGAAADVAVPFLGADTWYLIQGRVNESVVTVSRPEWNNVTKDFGVDLMSIFSNVIELQAKVGSTLVPLPDLGWVPIAAVLARMSGATDPSDLRDMRPLAADQLASSDGEELMLRHDMRSNFGFSVDVPSTFLMSPDVDLYDRGGRRLFAHMQSDTASLDMSGLLSPGLSLTNATWYYLYLCRWAGKYAPRGAYSGVTSQGVLVISDVPPAGQGRRDNSAPILLPDPWGAQPVAAGEAICIAPLASDGSNAAALGFRGISVRKGTLSIELALGLGSVFGNNLPMSATILPRNCRGFVPRARCDGSAGNVTVRVQTPSSSPTRQMHITMDRELDTFQQLAYFDCRGVLPTAIYVTADTGFVLGDIYEMEI